MKILMCNSFGYLRGGAERCFLELSQLLTAQGHEVIPFCMQDERNFASPYAEYFLSPIDFPSRLRNKGVRPKVEVLERVLYSREAYQKISALLAATQPDIAHIHGIAHETSPSILPAIKAAGIPMVQTLHDYKLLCPNTNFVAQGQVCERCKGHRYFNVVRYRCKRDALAASVMASVEMYLHKALQIYERHIDTFITPSQFLQHKIAEYGIKNRVVHLPNFIDPDKFQPCYTPDNYFLYCGRLVGVKGIDTLLQAMQQVRSAHLYIAGQGEREAALHSYVNEQQLSNVTFLGHLDTAQLVPLLQRAAFLVAPSEWYENYSMTILEAFACGTPVIGARIGGIPEQVIDGVTGLLFEPGNPVQLAEKIQYLLAQPALARTMGQTARQQVETINHPQTHYQQTLTLYQDVIGRHRTQCP